MLMLMASMLPIVVLMCLALAVTTVLFTFAAFSNEKKYLKLIQRISHEINTAQQDDPVDAAKPPHR